MQSLPSFDVTPRVDQWHGMTEPDLNPDIVLALAYAPRALRPAFTTLFRLDALLTRIAEGAREPILARIKLAWWGEQLAQLGTDAYRVDPLLIDCNDLVCRYDVTPASLAAIAHGYDDVLADRLAVPPGDGAVLVVAMMIAGVDPASRFGVAVANRDQYGLARKDWPKPLRTFRLLSAFARYDREAGRSAHGTPRRFWHIISALLFDWR